MAVRIFDKRIFDNDPNDHTLGFDWGGLIGVGIQTGVGLLQGQGQGGQCRAPAGCFQCQMTGQGDIAGCLDALFVGSGGLTTMLVNGRIPNDQVLSAHQQALAAISNAQLFKQTDAYLIQAKQVIQARIAAYQPTGGTTTQTVIGANGQPVTVTVPASSGIDTTTILLVGGALALILMLKN